MDAVKLYNEWKKSKNTEIFAEIADVPESSGGIDIADIKSAKSCFYIKDGTLRGELCFEKNFKAFTVYLSGVSRIAGDFSLTDSGGKLTLSVENGLESLTLSVKQGGEPALSADFKDGRIVFDSVFANF